MEEKMEEKLNEAEGKNLPQKDLIDNNIEDEGITKVCNDDTEQAKERLNEARKKITLLKDNIDNFGVCEFLKKASLIRDHIIKDDDITKACNKETSLADQRKELLDEIQKLQMHVITKNTQYEGGSITPEKAEIVDLGKAKAALASLAEKELEQKMFNETEKLKLYEGITECKRHTSTLNHVVNNCKYGKYSVLIMGDFQSGKSTTLDAICDGRLISAIGSGIATSAVPVSVTYAETESINIRWKSKKQFQPIFSKIQQYLPDFDWDSFDLDDSSSRKMLADIIEKFKGSKDCPKAGEGDVKFLMLCSMVLRYYGSDELDKEKSRLQSISNISDATRFPDKGESKWLKSGVSDLTIDESIFVFMDKVECYIPSETLRDLNCTITDTPGLFNSSYDTMVTEKEMVKAHAIMYILPYQKGIGQDVCKSLYTIKDNYSDVQRKLFIVQNYDSLKDSEFFDSNCDQISSMFGKDKTVKKYEAKLSYLTQVRLHVTDGSLPKNEYNHLLEVRKKSYRGTTTKQCRDFNEAWNNYRQNYGIENSLPPKEILKETGFEEMITSLKNFIAKNEAYSVILSNGIIQMQCEMEAIRNSLYRSYVEAYFKDADEKANLWKDRIDKAEYFQNIVKEKASDIFFSRTSGSSLCDEMATEEFSKLFTNDFFEKMTYEVCGVLYDNKAELCCTKTLLSTNKEKFKKRFTDLSKPYMQEKIIDLTMQKLIYWLRLIESEQDIIFRNIFAPNMKILENDLLTEWKKLYVGDEEIKMQNFLDIPKSLKWTKPENNEESYEINTGINSDDIGDISPTLLSGLITQISLVVSGYVVFIGLGIMSVFFAPGAQFLAALGMGVTAVAINCAPNWTRKEFVKILSKKLYPRVTSDDAINKYKDIVNKLMESMLTSYVNNLKVNIQKMENERDIALKYSNQESSCFRAVENIIAIKEKLGEYEAFKKEHVKDETD